MRHRRTVRRDAYLAAGVPAEDGTVVDERDARAVPRGGDGGAESARPRADDDKVVAPRVGDRFGVRARKAPTRRRARRRVIRRDVGGVLREQERIAPSERAGEVLKRDLRLACGQLPFARKLPAPSFLAARAEFASGPARDGQPELPRVVFGEPVLRARPCAPDAGLGESHRRRRGFERLQHTGGEEVCATHLVGELSVETPLAVVCEAFRLKPEESLHGLLRALRRRAEAPDLAHDPPCRA